MASMSYCRWQNIHEDMRLAVQAFLNGHPLNEQEQDAMKECCELFVELLQHAHISDEGYKEVDAALTDLYTEIETSGDEKE